ncbi:MAG: hypothetical protein IJ062_07410 [Firmicutes bacterium]|nr:hypothetical protein [Bacillota bacterium]
MILVERFKEDILWELEHNSDDLMQLRGCLVKYRVQGMNKSTMIKILEELRKYVDQKTEDVLLELLDFTVGFCNPKLSIYED